MTKHESSKTSLPVISCYTFCRRGSLSKESNGEQQAASISNCGTNRLYQIVMCSLKNERETLHPYINILYIYKHSDPGCSLKFGTSDISTASELAYERNKRFGCCDIVWPLCFVAFTKVHFFVRDMIEIKHSGHCDWNPNVPPTA